MGKRRYLARRTCVCLAVGLLIAFMTIAPAAAQIQNSVTYTYTGNPFDVEGCEAQLALIISTATGNARERVYLGISDFQPAADRVYRIGHGFYLRIEHNRRARNKDCNGPLRPGPVAARVSAGGAGGCPGKPAERFPALCRRCVPIARPDRRAAPLHRYR